MCCWLLIMNRQRSQRRAIDVQHYSDLTHADIVLLTDFLSIRITSSTQDQEQIRASISELPTHLRSKIPWITSSCTVHSKINPLPISSILKALRNMVEDDVSLMADHLRAFDEDHDRSVSTLTRLEDLAALWLRPQAFEQRYGRPPSENSPYDYYSTKCGSCILVSMSQDVDTLIALGGCFIGITKTAKWKGSKRIIWLEEWIRSLSDELEPDAAIAEKWKLGTDLRRRRKSAPKRDHDHRGYVDEYIAEAKRAELAPSRPSRTPSQLDHVAIVSSTMSDGESERREGSPDTTTLQHNHELSLPLRRVQRKPVPQPSPRTIDDDDDDDDGYEDYQASVKQCSGSSSARSQSILTSVEAASSDIYEDQRWFTPPSCSTRGVVGACQSSPERPNYGHSAVRDYGTASRSRTSTRIETVKNPRSRLRSVMIPRESGYEGMKSVRK